MNVVKEVIWRVASGSILRMLAAISNYLYGVLIARTTDLESAGNVFYGLAILYVVASFARMGSDSLVVRNIAISNNEKSTSALFAILLIAGSIASLIGIPIYLLSNSQKMESLGILIAGTLPLNFIYFAGEIFKGQSKSNQAIFLQNVLVYIIAPSVLFLSSKFILEPQGNQVAFLFLTSLVFVVILICAIPTLNPLQSISWEKHLKILDLTNALKSSSPFILIAIFGTSIPWFDTIILGLFSSPDDVAVYAAAARTSLLVSFVLVSINIVVMPKLSRLHYENKTEELIRLTQICTWTSTLSALIIAIIIWSNGEMISRVYGLSYKDGNDILNILVLGQLINSACGPVGYLLIMTKFEKLQAKIVIGASIAGLSLGFLLVPAYGKLGAAYSSIILISTMNVAGLLVVRSKFGFLTFGLKQLYHAKRQNHFQ